VGLRGGLQAVDIATGKPKWRFRTGASVSFPIVVDGTALLPVDADSQ
jgi:outer membrane protein assembly factor BamB